MAYTLPTFNLTCNIYTTTGTWPATPRLSSLCNLALGRRVESHGFVSGSLNMALLLPAGTDIRAGPVPNPPGNDTVEVPAGSGRTYAVLAVDDIGKGFPNEHRVAILTAVSIATHFWPTPIP